MDKLPPFVAIALEQVMEGDRKFFEENSDQDYYVRPITEAEILEGKFNNETLTKQTQVFVGQIQPGTRMRIFFSGRPPLAEWKRRGSKRNRKGKRNAAYQF